MCFVTSPQRINKKKKMNNSVYGFTVSRVYCGLVYNWLDWSSRKSRFELHCISRFHGYRQFLCFVRRSSYITLHSVVRTRCGWIWCGLCLACGGWWTNKLFGKYCCLHAIARQQFPHTPHTHTQEMDFHEYFSHAQQPNSVSQWLYKTRSHKRDDVFSTRARTHCMSSKPFNYFECVDDDDDDDVS